MLDGTIQDIEGLKLASGQNFSILKSNYNDHDKQPYYRIGSIRYKIIQ